MSISGKVIGDSGRILIEMLTTVKRARDEIILKLDTVQRVKPGTFVRPVDELLRKEDAAKITSSSVTSAKPMDDQVMKILEKQSQLNKEA